MEYILTTNDICKSYGKTQVLKDVSLHIPKGAIYGLIGKNGAGKTTIMRVISGLQRPSSGTYTVCGVNNTAPEIITVRRRIGAIIESVALYKDLSAYDNLKIQCINLGLTSYDKIDELLKLVGLDKTGRKPAGKFSLGMRQRLGIAVALCGSPDILILDEPINGLDPEGIIEIREMLLDINRNKGTTILISSHLLDELSRVADCYGFIDEGKIIREVSKEDLEKSLRKSTSIKVSDIDKTVSFLDGKGLEYEVAANEGISIFADDIKPSDLVVELSGIGVDVLNISQNEETLESYFMNLISDTKGDGNA
ncbi:MAG: ABC transporter ATP-binding protein [Clostridiales bacterium]|nr:ABC transporter ATP-binding protein [Clostridiales bacterium]